MGVFVNYTDFNKSNMYSFTVHSELIPNVQNDIVMYEKKWLIKMFGLDFALDLLANNTASEYDVLKSDLVVIEHCHLKKLYSRGLKFALLGLIYFDLNKSLNYVGTSSGTKKVNQDLVMSGSIVQLVNMRFNESVNDVRAMQEYIRRHREDFTKEYDGERFIFNQNF